MDIAQKNLIFILNNCNKPHLGKNGCIPRP